MAKHKLCARVRDQKGKEAAKKLRNEEKIPAIFYGSESEPVMLIIENSDLNSILKTSASENIIIDLEIESEKGSQTKMVILKELQTEPIKGKHLHADFYEIDRNREITVDVPIILLNTPLGVTNGGILQHIRRDITVSCLPDKMIDTLEIDVSGLDVGQSLHISDLNLPEGITSTQEENLTIAVLTSPAVTASDTETEEEGEDAASDAGHETEGDA